MIGKKAENLFKLIDNGYNVPKFIALDKQFFIDYLKAIEEYDEVELVVVKASWLKSVFEDLYRNILNHEFPDDLKGRIKELVKNFDTKLAIRSSSSCEDGIDCSSAGLFESYLNVDNENLFDAIKRVIASLYNENVLQAVHNNDFHPDNYYMGVIIQEMIEADYSGVMFSCNPTNYNTNEIVIESVNGICESLVSGEKMSNQIIINKTEECPIDAIIPVDILDQLKSTCLSLEKIFGSYVDVEWAVKNNVLYIIQCRNVTTVKKISEANIKYFDIEDLNENRRYLLGLNQRFSKWMKKRNLKQFCNLMNYKTYQWRFVYFNKDNYKDIDYNQLFSNFTSKYTYYFYGSSFVTCCRTSDFKNVVEKYVSSNTNYEFCFSLRECLLNELAIVSQLLEDGTIKIECVSGKMTNLKNGTINPTIYVVNSNGEIIYKTITKQKKYIFDTKLLEMVEAESTIISIDESKIKQIVDVTLSFTKRFGMCTVEAWISGDELYITDMSLLNSKGIPNHKCIVSPGYVEGIVRKIPYLSEMKIRDLNLFSTVSVSDTNFDFERVEYFKRLINEINEWKKEGNVILYSESPYLFLAPFINQVSGFIFKNASSLSHLSIIIREMNKPALQLLDLDIEDYSNKKIELDCNLGIIHK